MEGHRGAAVFGGGIMDPGAGEVISKAGTDTIVLKAGAVVPAPSAANARPLSSRLGAADWMPSQLSLFRMSMPPGSKQCEGLNLGCL